MPTPSITHAEEWMQSSVLGELPAERRVLLRLETGALPQTSLIPGLIIGCHSACIVVDSGDYQGRHRAAEVAAA